MSEESGDWQEILKQLFKTMARNPQYLIYLVAAFLGARAFYVQTRRVDMAMVGASLGVIGIRLATSPNIPSSMAGIGILGALGIGNVALTVDLSVATEWRKGIESGTLLDPEEQRRRLMNEIAKWGRVPGI